MNRHGLTPKEQYLICKESGFCCPIAGHDFWSDNEMKVLLKDLPLSEGLDDDLYPVPFDGFSEGKGDRFYKNKGKKACIDHDHETGFIRGILSAEANLLCRETAFNSGANKCFFGEIKEPDELTEYKKNPPAFRVIGQRKYE